MGRIFWNLKFVCIVGVTHADAQIEDLAKDVAGKVAEVGLLVVAGEVLDQHAEMGPALVLANGHLVEVIAKVLQPTALPNLPEEGGQIEHKGYNFLNIGKVIVYQLIETIKRKNLR